jgi:hypothetical protein
MTSPRTMDYRAKVHAHIREGEEIMARQQAAAATLDRDSAQAHLAQKLLRLLEHVHRPCRLPNWTECRENNQR